MAFLNEKSEETNGKCKEKKEKHIIIIIIYQVMLLKN